MQSPLKPALTFFFVAVAVSACSTTYPIKDAKGAIAVAMEVCHEKPDQIGEWKAVEGQNGVSWLASRSLPGYKGYVVLVPKNGPRPSQIVPCRFLSDLGPKT
jgi:hypothetical protein